MIILKETILSDRSRFWLIACNQVAWDYLDCVCQLSAYCGETFVLPTLDGEQLQAWLTSVTETMSVDFDSDRDRVEKAQAEFFKQIEVVSEGISTVAAQLLMRSLAYQTPDEDDSDRQGKVKTETPTSPKLPKLSPEEHYLLYSVLLHHEISLFHLANSLGDEPAVVQNFLQNLRRQGVIEQRHQLLRVNPLYYPRLKEELDGNNFPIN